MRLHARALPDFGAASSDIWLTLRSDVHEQYAIPVDPSRILALPCLVTAVASRIHPETEADHVFSLKTVEVDLRSPAEGAACCAVRKA